MFRYPGRTRFFPEGSDPWTRHHTRILDSRNAGVFFRDVRHFLLKGGVAYWIAGEGGISPDPLRLVSSREQSPEHWRELLGRIRIRRGFTKNQLNAILGDLSSRIASETVPCLLLFSGFEPSENLSPGDSKRLQKEIRRLFGRGDPKRFRLFFLQAADPYFTADIANGDGYVFPEVPAPYSTEGTMGKSVSTFREQVEHEEKSWKPFRKGLSRAEQDILDRLFETSRLYVHAGGEMSGQTHPFNVLLLTMILDMSRRIGALEEDRSRRP
jgi:hypothetical protein